MGSVKIRDAQYEFSKPKPITKNYLLLMADTTNNNHKNLPGLYFKICS